MSHYAPLNVDQIEASREHSRIGSRIVMFQSTASTNDIAWEYARNIANDGLCVLAESQRKGRGRRGRTWFCEPHQSILCSVLLTKTDIEAELLTLTAAVATAEAITQTYKLPARIKWPNDILIHNKKIAGILVEKRIKGGVSICVIGIGINCNQMPESFAKYDLNLPATSLAIETGEHIDRTEFVCALLKQLEHWLKKAKGDRVIKRWLRLSGMLGHHITIEYDGEHYSGFCRGVDPVNGLILQLVSGTICMFPASQTSIIPSKYNVDT